MQSEKERTRLLHMRDAATKATKLCEAKSRKDLESDEVLALALTRLVEIIGEAAKGVSPEVRSRSPGIPWREIAGTRDRLIHGYFDVDLDQLWQIVKSDLPALLKELGKLTD